jgi:hypothetical protein
MENAPSSSKKLKIKSVTNFCMETLVIYSYKAGFRGGLPLSPSRLCHINFFSPSRSAALQ